MSRLENAPFLKMKCNIFTFLILPGPHRSITACHFKYTSKISFSLNTFLLKSLLCYSLNFLYVLWFISSVLTWLLIMPPLTFKCTSLDNDRDSCLYCTFYPSHSSQQLFSPPSPLPSKLSSALIPVSSIPNTGSKQLLEKIPECMEWCHHEFSASSFWLSPQSCLIILSVVLRSFYFLLLPLQCQPFTSITKISYSELTSASSLLCL